MTTATINAQASGLWSIHEGESVDVVRTKPNGHATYVLRDDQKKPEPIPTRWLDMPEPEPECCPTCGRPIGGVNE